VSLANNNCSNANSVNNDKAADRVGGLLPQNHHAGSFGFSNTFYYNSLRINMLNCSVVPLLFTKSIGKPKRSSMLILEVYSSSVCCLVIVSKFIMENKFVGVESENKPPFMLFYAVIFICKNSLAVSYVAPESVSNVINGIEPRTFLVVRIDR
jgi:hypothetical protein